MIESDISDTTTLTNVPDSGVFWLISGDMASSAVLANVEYMRTKRHRERLKRRSMAYINQRNQRNQI